MTPWLLNYPQYTTGFNILCHYLVLRYSFCPYFSSLSASLSAMSYVCACISGVVSLHTFSHFPEVYCHHFLLDTYMPGGKVLSWCSLFTFILFPSRPYVLVSQGWVPSLWSWFTLICSSPLVVWVQDAPLSILKDVFVVVPFTLLHCIFTNILSTRFIAFPLVASGFYFTGEIRKMTQVGHHDFPTKACDFLS